eukprot:TRINITY_DN8172_c1_g2_i7.p2 TRINITY_DN8172_c1_g2~~TRINITY_DN8172_c1_g2_i7.p2  ORF type:complete len:349 (-),score=37.57 TRINITY_DN8172_c1_g2_i7:209-1255(-)
MRTATASESATVMWALSQHRQIQAFETRQIRQKSVQTMDTLDLEQGARMAHAFGINEIYDKQLFNSLNRRIKNLLEEYEHDQDQKQTDQETFLNLIEGFSKVRQYDEQLFDRFCQHVHDLSFRQQLQAMHNCAIVNHKYLDLIQSVKQQFIQQIDQLGEKDVCETMWSIAILNVDLSDEWWSAIFRRLQQLDVENFSPENIKILQIIQLYFNSQNQKFDLDNVNLDKLSGTGQVEKRIVPKFKSEVAQILKEQLELEFEDLEERSLSLLDFEVYKEGSRIFLQVDGPDRFTLNMPYREIGSTSLKKRILRGKGIKPANVAFFEWNKMTNDFEKGSLLNNKLQSHISAS